MLAAGGTDGVVLDRCAATPWTGQVGVTGVMKHDKFGRQLACRRTQQKCSQDCKQVPTPQWTIGNGRGQFDFREGFRVLGSLGQRYFRLLIRGLLATGY